MISEKTVLLTGSSSGIGLATAQCLLDSGWSVIGLSRKRAEIDHPEYRHLSIDLRDVDLIPKALEDIEANAIVHAAGFMRVESLGKLLHEDHQEMWRVHVLAAEMIVNGLVGRMRNGGRIVLVGSRASSGIPNRSQYGATKAALVSMARSWAAELASRQITCNVVSPAATLTPMLHDSSRSKEQPKMPPIGRYIEPMEVAAAIRFLLSPEAGAITGQQLTICGGSSL